MRPIHWNPFIFRKETVLLLKKRGVQCHWNQCCQLFFYTFYSWQHWHCQQPETRGSSESGFMKLEIEKESNSTSFVYIDLEYQIQNWSPLLTILYSTIVSDFTEEKRLSRISSRRPPPPFWKETANRLEGEFTFLIALFFVVVRLGP